jgi:hypothetical protein
MAIYDGGSTAPDLLIHVVLLLVVVVVRQQRMHVLHLMHSMLHVQRRDAALRLQRVLPKLLRLHPDLLQRRLSLLHDTLASISA